jgi:photosystem II stability/assembly factor-like uncharacterized protein
MLIARQTKNYTILFLLLVGLVVLIQLLNEDNYESFLVEENKKISNLEKQLSKIKNRPDKPDLAALQNYLMIIDPNLKHIPVNRLKESYTNLKKKRFKETTNNISWTSLNSNIAGRTRCLKFDPNNTDNQKVWAGSATGGLWFNNNIFDETSSWNPVNDFWESLSVSSIAFDPNNNNIMYVGTGEAETAITTYRESSGRGNGIWKSTDGGANWTQLSSTKDFAYITDIELKDESGNSVLYVAVVSGNYQGEIFQSTPTDGLYRSIDDGTTWEQVLPNIPGNSTPFAPSDIEITANGKIFVGTMPDLNEQGGAQILMSETGVKDSWSVYSDYSELIMTQPSFNIPGRVKITSSDSDPNRIYAFFASGSLSETVQTFKSYNCEYIISSNDEGLTWTQLPLPDVGNRNWAYLAWHALAAEVDPNDPNTIYIGGLDLFKSTDGGQNWQNVSDWAANYNNNFDDYVHADQHCIKFQSGSSSNITFCTDGGVFITENGNLTDPIFKERNQNFNTLQFYTGAISPNENYAHYAGGLQDNGTVYYKGTPININDMINGGDGAYCFVKSNNRIISSVYNNRYEVAYNGNIINSINAYSGTFISPADYIENIDVLYANAQMFDGTKSDQILRVKNISGSYNISFHNLNTGTSVPFSAIKIHPQSTANNTILFIGTQAGRLFKVQNAESTPIVTEITGYNFPAANISCIDISANGETILVTFSNYGVNSVWISIDGGNNWQSIENNLPDIPVRWGLLHTNNPKQIMLATEIGIWVADDVTQDNFEWEIANSGLANVRVDMIRMRAADEVVLAATHGRGLFTTKFESNIPISSINDMTLNTIAAFPNPTNGRLTLNYQGSKIEMIKVYNITGKLLGKIKPKSKIIDISSFGKGFRILKISTSKTILTSNVFVF